MIASPSFMLEKHKAAILETLFQSFDERDCLIFLFGSFAQGTEVQSSDIDIGILSCKKISPKQFLEAKEELEQNISTLKKIDLVDFNSVDDTVKKEAFKEMQIWHIGKNCRTLLKSLKRA